MDSPGFTVGSYCRLLSVTVGCTVDSRRQIPAWFGSKNGRSCDPSMVYAVSCRDLALIESALQAGGRRFEPGWLHFEKRGPAKLFGLARDMLIGYRYGTSVESDAYFAAYRMTITIFLSIGSAITATVIPFVVNVAASI